MIDNLGGVTSQVAWLALDALALRHELTAHNIANAETPGFVPKRLEFAARLRGVVEMLQGGAGSPGFDQALEQLRADLRAGELTNAPTDQLVEVDMEMVDLTANVLQYRAIIEAQAKRGELLRLAIRERSA
jgi:flagellar basal-body rod protein FlgB